MSSSCTSAALLCLLAGAMAAIQTPQTVFLDKQQASSLISRQKRNTDQAQPADIEQICMEKVCTYEQARSVFKDTYRTDIFWSVYVDGDQCAEKPCKNGALCSDSVGGYDCVCKSGFSGYHCEIDQTLCPVKPDEGCSQFCKPGYTSYECSCARGWKVSRTDKKKCEPAQNPCGKLGVSSQTTGFRQRNLVENNYEAGSCSSGECPWQALLKSSESAGFCSGVILKENLVLTSAQCAKKYSSFQVAVGKLTTAYASGEQTLNVGFVITHPRYDESRPENDLAVIKLTSPIRFKKEVVAACLPEKDFADSILMSGDHTAVITSWKEAKEGLAFQGSLLINHLQYKPLSQCLETQPNMLTNKMGCTAPRTNADCTMGSGSPLLTVYKDVYFLTGVVSQPAGANCSHGYIFQKVSRHLSWLQNLMNTL